MRKNITINKNNGFTLVEMLVSLAVFVIITAIVGGIYTTFVQKQRDQLGQQNVQQDVQNFFDTLEREIRTGYGDTFLSASAGSLEFFNQDGTDISYTKNGNAIKRNNVAITSDRTYVEDLRFSLASVSTKSPDDGSGYFYLVGVPTRVTVSVKACVDSGNSCLLTQTSLSIRQFKPKP